MTNALAKAFVPPRRRSGPGAARTFESTHVPGTQGSNRVVAMSHVVEVGSTNACMQAALGDIIDQVVGGKIPPGQLVRELGTVRSAAQLCSTVVGASAGKLTAKGANTTGVGGSWVAKRVNQRMQADQKEADLLLGLDDGTRRTALGELANTLDRPSKMGVVETTFVLPQRSSKKRGGKPQHTTTNAKRSKVRESISCVHPFRVCIHLCSHAMPCQLII